MPDARTAASWAILAGGLCITLGSLIYAGQPKDFGWFVGAAPYLGWALVPYGVHALAVRLVAGSPAASRVLLLASALLVGMTSGLLYQTFVLAPDAQGGLVFLFLPLWQLLGLLPFWGIAWRARVRERAAR